VSTVEQGLNVRVERQGAGTVVYLNGSATMDRCDALSETLQEAVDRQGGSVVLDLSGLEFICSLGLGGIVEADRLARRTGGRVRLCAPRPEIAKLLHVTKLDHLLGVFATPQEALAVGCA